MKILLMYSPSESHARELTAAAPGATFSIATDQQSARELIRDADAVLGNRYLLESIEHAQGLRWVQSNSVGMDLVLRGGPRLRDLTVTNVRGVYSIEMAEHALALVLGLFRCLHEFRDDQFRHLWNPRKLSTISGSAFLILGWGSVGSAIGERLHALGGQVFGVSRDKIVECTDEAEQIVTASLAWRALLPRVDCVVMALPLTSDTSGIMSREEIALLRPSACIVNVGRGKTLDEAALLEALKESRLAGAAVDVLDDEPPKEESAIWSEPSLVITPHVARSRETAPYEWEPLFVENLRRFSAGLPLLNVVDQDRAY